MNELFNQFIIYFITLFFIIDVIGLTPIYLTLTNGYEKNKKIKTINRGIITALIVLIIFALSGLQVLNLFGISLAAFKLAGGILLLLLSIDMVLGKQSQEKLEQENNTQDISVFPLAIPLLSGPAAISMLIIYMKQAETDIFKQVLIILALFLNMIVSWIVLRFADLVTKFLGKTGINILTKIFAILMTALACQFILSGVIEAFHIK